MRKILQILCVMPTFRGLFIFPSSINLGDFSYTIFSFHVSRFITFIDKKIYFPQNNFTITRYFRSNLFMLLVDLLIVNRSLFFISSLFAVCALSWGAYSPKKSFKNYLNLTNSNDIILSWGLDIELCFSIFYFLLMKCI